MEQPIRELYFSIYIPAKPLYSGVCPAVSSIDTNDTLYKMKPSSAYTRTKILKGVRSIGIGDEAIYEKNFHLKGDLCTGIWVGFHGMKN